MLMKAIYFQLHRLLTKIIGVVSQELLRPGPPWREGCHVLIELCYQSKVRKESVRELDQELGGIGGDALGHARERIKKTKTQQTNISEDRQELSKHQSTAEI